MLNFPSSTCWSRFFLIFAATGLLLAGAGRPALAARAERLELRRLELQLAGPPVSILSGDLNADDRLDLLVVTAFTYWGETSTYSTEMVDGKMWEMVQVVPSLIDQRQWQLYLAQKNGSFAPAAPPQELPSSVLAFAQGPPAHPILALTDDGVASVGYDDGGVEAPLFMTPVIATPPVFAGSGGLLPGYDFTGDVDDDGVLDILLPAAEGLQLHLTRGVQFIPAGPALKLPGDLNGRDGVTWRSYPLPHIQDVDGDGISDLVVYHKAGKRRLVRFENNQGLGAISVLRGTGGGTFSAAEAVHRAQAANPDNISAYEAFRLLTSRSELSGTLTSFDDIDGDGRAELVTYEEMDQGGGDGFRQEMKEAKRPLHEYRLYRLDQNLQVAREPYLTFTAQGYPFLFDWLGESNGGFVDLDGNGRLDLVTADLDFSLWQLPKILMARTIGLGLDFHVWAQQPDGTFREVKASRVRGKLKVNLRQMKLTEFAQFGGDYDGDGRIDFISLGGGRKVSIHRGQEGAVYPLKPDLTISLHRSPDDTGLIKAPDLDGDGRSDLLVVTILKADEEGVTRPTRVEIYLTGKMP
jgi:hypothetical protein